MVDEQRQVVKGPLKGRPRADPVVAALYATSGNMCGYSDPDTGYGCEQVIYKAGFESVMAEIAHIVGLNPTSCRYRDDLTAHECQEKAVVNWASNRVRARLAEAASRNSPPSLRIP